MLRLGPNTASETKGGQFDDGENSTEVIYRGYDQDPDPGDIDQQQHEKAVWRAPIFTSYSNLRVYFNQSRTGDGWNSREFYFVSVKCVFMTMFSLS